MQTIGFAFELQRQAFRYSTVQFVNIGIHIKIFYVIEPAYF